MREWVPWHKYSTNIKQPLAKDNHLFKMIILATFTPLSPTPTPISFFPQHILLFTTSHNLIVHVFVMDLPVLQCKLHERNILFFLN